MTAPKAIFLQYSWKTNTETKPQTHYTLRTLWRKEGVGYNFYSSRLCNDDLQDSLDHFLKVGELTLDDVYFAESYLQAMQIAQQHNISLELPTAILYLSTDLSDKKYYSVEWAQDRSIVGRTFTTQDMVRQNYPKHHSKSNLSFSLEKAGLPSDEAQMIITPDGIELTTLLSLMP